MGNNRIAVVNRTNFKNYGSVLQCFALCEAIKQLGYDCEIIWAKGGLSKNYDIRINKAAGSFITLIKNPSLMASFVTNLKSVKTTEISDRKVIYFEKFVRENIRQKLYSNSELKKMVKAHYYKKYVCGSDQIWNPHTLYLDPLLFLRFAPMGDRVAYAPSLGCNELPSYNKKQLKKYITGIPYVSIREKKGQELLFELCGNIYPVVLDPTLLHDKEFWHKYVHKIEDQSYILCYFLNTPSTDIQQRIQKYALENQKTIIELNTHMGKYDSQVTIKHIECGPAEFLSYTNYADMIFTDSYHGMLFSIIFEKEFYSIKRNYEDVDQSSRQLSILNDLNLKHRYIDDTLTLEKNVIDYKSVKEKISCKRNDSIDYLRKSLNGEYK